MTQTIAELQQICAEVVVDGDRLTTYGRDWTKTFKPEPLCVIFPRQVNEVAKILEYCNRRKLAVVPSGGRTGLSGGAVAHNHEVVISMEKLNRIEAVDPVSMSIRVEAGVTTQAVQQAAQAQGLFFSFDLAARGSSQIGGNIATNAGGTKFIRYGGMREQVLGIEVVLASGEILDLNTNLRKDNSGYDLKHLFIGSEGTLGIIARATLKLMPTPVDLQVMLVSFDDIASISRLMATCHRVSLPLTAFEFFSNEALEIVLKQQTTLSLPFKKRSSFYALVEAEKLFLDDGENPLMKYFDLLFSDGLIEDAVIAQSSSEFRQLWALRENISESLSGYGHVLKSDVSIGLDQIGAFVLKLVDLQKEAQGSCQVIVFGHVGDGNLHINYVAPKSASVDEFNRAATTVEKKVLDLVQSCRGSISAEHGIGLLKKDILQLRRSEREIDLMRSFKKVLDPNQILNPGKIFD